jgi:hypothetical protein
LSTWWGLCHWLPFLDKVSFFGSLIIHVWICDFCFQFLNWNGRSWPAVL